MHSGPGNQGTGNHFAPKPPKWSQSPVSVQYHPESSPGPHDSLHLFDRFIDAMEAFHA